MSSDLNNLFRQYPLTVPIRGFLGNYKNFGSGQLPTSTFIFGPLVVVQGTVGINSGDIAYDDPWFNLPNGFELTYNDLASIALFTSPTFHPDIGFLNMQVNNSGVDTMTAIVKYPGTVTGFVFSQFSTIYQKAPIIEGGLSNTLGTGPTLDGVSVIFPSITPSGKVCMYFHGTGDDQYSHLSSPAGVTSTQVLMRSTVLALLADGYIIISSAGGAVTDNYGNPASSTASINALTWLKSIISVNKIVVLSQSMGGLPGLRVACQYPGINKWYGIYPLVNLAWSYTGSGNLFQSGLNTAYGVSDQSQFTAASVGCDPLLFPLTQYNGKNFRMTASSGDTIVVKSDNATALQIYITGNCASVSVVNTTGNHGDPSNFIPSDIIAFFDAP